MNTLQLLLPFLELSKRLAQGASLLMKREGKIEPMMPDLGRNLQGTALLFRFAGFNTGRLKLGKLRAGKTPRKYLQHNKIRH